MSKLSKGKNLLAQRPTDIAAEPGQTSQREQQTTKTIRCTVTLVSSLALTAKVASHIEHIEDMLPRGAIAPTPATVLREFLESKDGEIAELFEAYLIDS